MKKQTYQSIFKTGLIALPLLISGGLIASCSTAHHQESTGQFVDGTVITTKVKAKLLADEDVNGLPITVKTYKNVVQLSGFVNNNFQKNRAVALARSVEGVSAVEDSLIIKKR